MVSNPLLRTPSWISVSGAAFLGVSFLVYPYFVLSLILPSVYFSDVGAEVFNCKFL